MPKEKVVTVTKSKRIVSQSEILAQSKAKENVLPSKPSVTEKQAINFLKLLKRNEFKVME